MGENVPVYNLVVELLPVTLLLELELASPSDGCSYFLMSI